ncbi:MAG: hypothetical protein HRF51_04520 [bacterium]|jgi:uroporphyrinogen decarboxylase
MLSHRERIQAIISGEKPDRPAVSFWRHFYHREATAEGLAEAMLAYQKKFDWDFMKINPRASYHVEDWGNRLAWSQSEFSKHQKLKFAVEKLEDWEKIKPLNPTAPVLAEHLRAVSLIKKGSDKNLPLFMTVFTPLSIAGDLVPEGSLLLRHLEQDETRVMSAVENITITFERYIAELRNAGADGIFLATTEWATSDMMSYDMYEKYARPYDLRILRAAGHDALNIIHICAANNFLKHLADYPAPLFNWDSCHPTNPTLDTGLEILKGRTLIGGIDHTGWLRHASPDEIKNETARQRDRYDGKPVIFGPGCTYEPTLPEENIRAVKDALGAGG